MKFVYFGTNQLSVIVLRHLLAAGFKPEAVVTPPDAPTGRSKVLTPCRLKVEAEKQGLAVIQPYSLKKDEENVRRILNQNAELGVVAAYGKLIPPNILNSFPKGVLNVHPSLLPKYRGPSPVQSAILNGEKETGATIMLLDEQMDHGPILVQEKLKIGDGEYFAELFERLADLGGELLTQTIVKWLNGQIAPVTQNESLATVCKKSEWQDGKLEFTRSVRETYNQIRALSHEPGAWLEMQIANSKLLRVKIIKARLSGAPFARSHEQRRLQKINGQLVLVLSDGYLILDSVLPQGKRIMTAKEFLAGYGKLLKD